MHRRDCPAVLLLTRVVTELILKISVLAALWLSPTQALAWQDAPTVIHVGFDFNESLAVDKDERANAEDKITNDLAMFLHREFPYWPFEPGKGKLPQVYASVEQRSEIWEINVMVAVSSSSRTNWSDKLYEASEIKANGGLPALPALTARILQRSAALIEKHKSEIKPLLFNNVSLITPRKRPEAITGSPTVEAVVPLRWEANQELRYAEFRVKYWYEFESKEVELLSRGTGKKSAYTPQHFLFCGLLIRFNESTYLAHFGELKFVGLLIAKEGDPDLPLVGDDKQPPAEHDSCHSGPR